MILADYNNMDGEEFDLYVRTQRETRNEQKCYSIYENNIDNCINFLNKLRFRQWFFLFLLFIRTNWKIWTLNDKQQIITLNILCSAEIISSTTKPNKS